LIWGKERTRIHPHFNKGINGTSINGTDNERTRSTVPTVADISFDSVATNWEGFISARWIKDELLLFLFPVLSSSFCPSPLSFSLSFSSGRRASPPSLHGMTRRLCSCSSTSRHFFCSLFSHHLFTRFWTRYADGKTTAETHNDCREWRLVYETATFRPSLHISIVGIDRRAAKNQKNSNCFDMSLHNSRNWCYPLVSIFLHLIFQ